jgi:hypothetical protein
MARELGVDERTIRRWTKLPGFDTELATARQRHERELERELPLISDRHGDYTDWSWIPSAQRTRASSRSARQHAVSQGLLLEQD